MASQIQNIERDRGQKSAAPTSTCARVETVNSIGTVRRLRALIALGWSQAGLAVRAGMSSRTVWLLVRHPELCPDVTLATRARVVELYDELSMKIPPESRHKTVAVRLARAAGWVPPLAWDDEDLDDPEGHPAEITPDDIVDVDMVAVRRVIDGGGFARLTRAEIDAAITYGYSQGLSSRQVAERLHMTQTNVEKRSGRHGLRAAA
ncbi:hypothetical protein [Demequina sp.]|uniref:hypothetical protein n=1 Tax=Demequina sp. TaxID=2050685 RepID=UPI003D115309